MSRINGAMIQRVQGHHTNGVFSGMKTIFVTYLFPVLSVMLSFFCAKEVAADTHNVVEGVVIKKNVVVGDGAAVYTVLVLDSGVRYGTAHQILLMDKSLVRIRVSEGTPFKEGRLILKYRDVLKIGDLELLGFEAVEDGVRVYKQYPESFRQRGLVKKQKNKKK